MIDRNDGNVDVLFEAKDVRPGWLGYGAGLLVGGWTAVWAGMVLWREWGWVGLMVWPMVWVFGLVVGSLVLFGLGSLLTNVLRFPRGWCRGVVSILIALTLGIMACLFTGSALVAERWLGWTGMLVVGALALGSLSLKRK
ncbi:hypothetical protein [Phragmitibacter flavus]|uniref:hypothetical protein n=1 Tax=Phragmitibacter flavus TaxID=2576071 RepID=UPI001409634E|nr:hypothetical protein [Phragmitibacter flavus]